MADTAEEVVETQETQDVFDLSKGEFVKVPVAGKEDTSKKEEPSEEEEEEEKEEDTSKEEEGKNDSSEEESSEEEEKEEEEEEEKEQSVTPDDFVKAVYEEKFGVKTQAELDELIETAADVMEEHEALKKEVADLKVQKPKFSSQEEEKAYDFIKKFGVPRQGEAFQTYAKLIAMDVDNADPRMLLEERFVHENPELTREEAQKKFARDFNRKYTLSRESFDGTDDEYKEELEMLEIDKKSEVNKAKKFLKEEQVKYKPAAKEDGPKVSETVKQSIEKNTSSYGSFAKDFKEITFEESGEKVVFQIDKDKNAMISNAMMEWVKNPANYDEKGKLVGVNNANEMAQQVAGALFLKDFIKAVVSQVKNSVSSKRIDEVAERKPESRKSVGGSKPIKGDDLYESAQELIRKKGK